MRLQHSCEKLVVGFIKHLSPTAKANPAVLAEAFKKITEELDPISQGMVLREFVLQSAKDHGLSLKEPGWGVMAKTGRVITTLAGGGALSFAVNFCADAAALFAEDMPIVDNIGSLAQGVGQSIMGGNPYALGICAIIMGTAITWKIVGPVLSNIWTRFRKNALLSDKENRFADYISQVAGIVACQELGADKAAEIIEHAVTTVPGLQGGIHEKERYKLIDKTIESAQKHAGPYEAGELVEDLRPRLVRAINTTRASKTSFTR